MNPSLIAHIYSMYVERFDSHFNEVSHGKAYR
jgi:hypothetical protein